MNHNYKKHSVRLLFTMHEVFCGFYTLRVFIVYKSTHYYRTTHILFFPSFLNNENKLKRQTRGGRHIPFLHLEMTTTNEKRRSWMFGYFMPITTATKCHQHNLQTWVINFHQGGGISATAVLFIMIKFSAANFFRK